MYWMLKVDKTSRGGYRFYLFAKSYIFEFVSLFFSAQLECTIHPRVCGCVGPVIGARDNIIIDFLDVFDSSIINYSYELLIWARQAKTGPLETIFHRAARCFLFFCIDVCIYIYIYALPTG